MNQHDTLIIGGEIEVDKSALLSLVQRHHIARLALFGSAARGELKDDSDIDLLIEFEAGKAPSLGGLVDIQDELSELLGGRRVDLATPSILNNPYRKRAIEHDLETLHAA